MSTDLFVLYTYKLRAFVSKTLPGFESTVFHSFYVTFEWTLNVKLSLLMESRHFLKEELGVGGKD